MDPQAITGLPEIMYKGQGGLLDVALHPDYNTNGWIYISYSSPKAAGEEGDDGGANTALLRAKLKDHALTDVQYLFKAIPNLKKPMFTLADGLFLTKKATYFYRSANADKRKIRKT